MCVCEIETKQEVGGGVDTVGGDGAPGGSEIDCFKTLFSGNVGESAIDLE